MANRDVKASLAAALASGGGVGRARRQRPVRAPARTRRRSSRSAIRRPGPCRRHRSRQGLCLTVTLGAQSSEPGCGGLGGIRAEQAPAPCRSPLVRIERGRHARVERIRREALGPTDDGERDQNRASPASAHARISSSSSPAVSRSSSAEAVTRAASASSLEPSFVTSETLGSMVTADPSAAGPGRLAPASVRRSGSRSWRTQCCGPRRSGASHRPIPPLPQPRSWTTRRPGRSAGAGIEGARMSLR